MKKGPEKLIEKKIRTYLEANGFLVIKIHGNQFQTSGWPDLFALKYGRLLAIEVKAPGKVPSDLQASKIEKLVNVGCLVIVASELETVKEAVAIFDMQCRSQLT